MNRPSTPARLWLALAAGILALGPSGARAAAADRASRQRPEATAIRIDGAEAPRIDGDLSDPVWQRAPAIGDFHQVDPQPLASATERTEVRFLYDAGQLYVAIYCHDSEPDRITSSVRERDGPMPRDDFVRIALDPQFSRRNAYAFEINPEGARTDALLQNNSQFLITWNMIWRGEARRVADGWMAEIALPFRGLSYPAGGGDWGLEVLRQIKRKSEFVRWSPTPAGMRGNDMSLAGTLHGLEGLPGGGKLDLQAFGALRYGQDWQDSHYNHLQGQPSATLYYKLNSSLTATLTANTDFSDAPLDNRRVNTGRFALFDPETREFFLQDAAAFSFGGMNFDVEPNGSPFFSRRIGMVDGRTTHLAAGAKLSGDAGPVSLGALTVRTHAQGSVAAQQFSVARLSTPVLQESAIGVILTHGDPLGSEANTVAGADFRFLDSDIGAGRRLKADGFYERSMSRSDSGSGSAWGAVVSLPNEPWSFIGSYKRIGSGFNPALGFVNRAGIRDAFAEVEHVWRPVRGPLQALRAGIDHSAIAGADGRLQTRNTALYVVAENRGGNVFELAAFSEYEFLAEAFPLPGGTVVPAGEHAWSHAKLRLGTSSARRLFMTWQVDCCRFYDGRILGNDIELTWRPTTLVDLSAHYVIDDIRLPSGRTQIRIGQLTLSLNFTPDMQLRSQLQYDSVSELMSALLRYRWEYAPGAEIFAALGEAARASGTPPSLRYHSAGSEVLVRLGHRFQF
jgi:hypothetical protein